MSDLTGQEKRDIAAATALTLVSWVAFWLFGFACGSVFWAQGF
jgi:hypothetical protein